MRKLCWTKAICIILLHDQMWLLAVQCDAVGILVGTVGVWHPMCAFIACCGACKLILLYSAVGWGRMCALPTYICGECSQPAFRALREAFQANKMSLNRELGLLSKPPALHKTGFKLPLYLFH